MSTEKHTLDETRKTLKLRFSTLEARYYAVIHTYASPFKALYFSVSGDTFLNFCANMQDQKENIELWEKTGTTFEYLGTFKY